jgi:hypothetical protein
MPNLHNRYKATEYKISWKEMQDHSSQI